MFNQIVSLLKKASLSLHMFWKVFSQIRRSCEWEFTLTHFSNTSTLVFLVDCHLMKQFEIIQVLPSLWMLLWLNRMFLAKDAVLPDFKVSIRMASSLVQPVCVGCGDNLCQFVPSWETFTALSVPRLWTPLCQRTLCMIPQKAGRAPQEPSDLRAFWRSSRQNISGKTFHIWTHSSIRWIHHHSGRKLAASRWNYRSCLKSSQCPEKSHFFK